MQDNEYVEGEDYDPGTWKYLKMKDSISASFTCPICHEPGTLSQHNIDDNGVVTPSVVCSYECNFHQNIRLLGWEKEVN